MTSSRFGFTVVRRRALYGLDHGFGHAWMPQVIVSGMVRAWNFFVCRLLGHDFFPLVEDGLVFCSYCNRSRLPTQEDEEWTAREEAIR